MPTYEEIFDSIRVDEVLDELGIDVVQIAKGEHWSSCPLPSHPGSDQSPSFSINEDILVYNCFVCGGGPLPKLVSEIHHSTWDEAVEWLVPFSDGAVDVDDDAGYMEQIKKYLERADEKPSRVRQAELPFYSTKILEKLPFADVEQLVKWGITEQETIEHHGIRYDENRRRRKGDKEYYGPALVIPHFFGGKLVGYQERWMDEDRPKWVPKYTNSDDFPKRNTLFGWDDVLEAAQRGVPVVTVESSMTRVRLWELGYTSVATFGASVSEEQIRLLRALPSGVVLSYDNDPDYRDAEGVWRQGAGTRATAKVADELTDFIPVWITPPMANEKGDLADQTDEEIEAYLDSAKAVFLPLANPKSRKQRRYDRK